MKKYFRIQMISMALFSSYFLLANKEPQRIVSCSLAGDEILLTLLPTKEKRKKIIALSKLADSPLYSNVKEEAKDISLRSETQIEHLISLKPDLVIAASYNQGEFLHRLKSLKINTHVMEGFNNLNNLRSHIKNIAKLIGEEERGEKILKEMSEKMSLQNKKKKKTKIMLVLPDKTVLGQETLIDDVLTQAGYVNIAHDLKVLGWQKVSDEKMLSFLSSKEGDIDFILTSAEEKERSLILESFSKYIPFSRIKNLSHKIILIPPSIYSSFSSSILELFKFIDRGEA